MSIHTFFRAMTGRYRVMMTADQILSINSCPIEEFDCSYLAEGHYLAINEFDVSYIIGFGYRAEERTPKKQLPIKDIFEVIS